MQPYLTFHSKLMTLTIIKYQTSRSILSKAICNCFKDYLFETEMKSFFYGYLIKVYFIGLTKVAAILNAIILGKYTQHKEEIVNSITNIDNFSRQINAPSTTPTSWT